MKCTFVVGQKVVCVHSGPWDSDYPGAPELDTGAIYTVRDLEIIDAYPNSVYLTLLESQGGGWRFNATSFRPVDERKTDISIFTALLTPAGQKKRIREDA